MAGLLAVVDDTLVTAAENAVSADDEFLKPPPFDPDGPTHHGCAPFAGERIGRYVLGDKLAHGAFGVVFRARDLELDREVALKLLSPDHANKQDVIRRFLREARTAARVVHPNVVTILDSGQYGGGAYIAMDLLAGESLTARLAHCGRLLVHDAVEIAREIAAALEATHAAGVVHRDLKPDNIFLVADPACPDGRRVKLLDFGLAKLVLDDPRRRTNIHSVLGTPRYMSPEQCRSSTQIDHRSDIYALGCILFELVTGVPPYDGSPDAVIDAHLGGAIPRASSLCRCPPQLDALITTLLAKDPARRPPTMTAVRRALDALRLGRLGSAPSVPPTRPERAALPRIMRPARAGQSQDTTSRTPRAAHDASEYENTIEDATIVTAPPAMEQGPRRARSAIGSAPPPPRPRFAPHRLPPYFPGPPTIASVHARTPPTPVPVNPSMSTAMAMTMAYAPAAMPAMPVVPIVTAPSVPALAHAVAVPICLPAPEPAAIHAQPAAVLTWPIVLVAIACALAGVLAALLIV